MTRRVALVTLVAVALSTGPAMAHDGHDHMIMGTVTAGDDKHLEVKTPSNDVLSIAVNDMTITVREKKKITFQSVQVGRLVLVNIGNGEDPLTAREIQVGVAQMAPK